MVDFRGGQFVAVNFDTLPTGDILLFPNGVYTNNSANLMTVGESSNNLITLAGAGFVYTTASKSMLDGGVIDSLTHTVNGNLWYDIRGLAHTVAFTGDYIQKFLTLSRVFVGDDRITGSALHDLLRGYGGADVMDGGNGSDAVYGGDGNDTITGGLGDDRVEGEAGADVLTGGFGRDTLVGGFGSDMIDGGDDLDTVIFSGAIGSFDLKRDGLGAWTVTDLRHGSPEGADKVVNIERLRFDDRTLSVGAPDAAMVTAIANVLREPTNWKFNDVAERVADRSTGRLTAVTELVTAADATTSVATLAYQFFTGKIPSAAGLDYLVSPTGANPNNLNSSYYQSFNIENRYINFAVNLGVLGEGKTSFAAAYGNKTMVQSVTAAYTTIFGSAPSAAKVGVILDSLLPWGPGQINRNDYFAYYGGDGREGIGAKAAMVGWLLAEAAKGDVGMYSGANNAFLTDLADGADLSIDLIGVYGKSDYIFYG